jgi:hypothetical protein
MNNTEVLNNSLEKAHEILGTRAIRLPSEHEAGQAQGYGV